MVTRQTNGNSSLEIAQSSQELVSKDRSNRKRTCLILGVIALGAIIVLVAAIVITSGGSSQAVSSNKLRADAPAITLEDFLEGRMIPRSFNATWISENELLYRDAAENIVIHNVVTRSTKVLVPVERLPPLTFDYELSADHNYLLVGHNYQKLYSRYSYLAQYTVIDVNTFERIPLTAHAKERILRLAVWGPSGNSLIYIFNNNIFFRPSVRVKAEIQLTNDGESQKFYNGIPDWVYEEEVLSSNKALWFSTTGKKLAFLTLNDSNVGIMNIPVYGQPENVEFLYTKTIPLRYPKAGTPNPEVGLVTVDLDAVSNFRLLPVQQAIPSPPALGRDPILGAASWADDEVVCAIWLNRIQNQAEIVCCDATTATCETIIHIEEKTGWLEMFTAPMFSKDGSKMLLIMSHDQGSGSGAYRHVTLIERKPNAKAIPLSMGKYVVTEILSWDETKQLVYFLGTSETDPAVQHLYSVSSNPASEKKQAQCVSCNTKSTTANKSCLYNGVIFSPNSSHYTLNCAGPGVPEISVYDKTHKKLETWETNEEIIELVEDKQTPIIKRFEVDVGGGFKAQVMLQLPPNIDTSGDIKYPMIVDVYGGPDSYDVVEKFSLNWFSYLAANKSIIVAVIDGRSSGLKGDKMLFAGYGHLGTVEIFDQINVTRHLQQELPYIDSKRTAIWGWSYGGYAAGLVLARDTQNIFKCGISIAPVTDWALYDSIYTERVMGLPNKNNIAAYKEAALLNKVEKFRNKQFLLVHGTMDDNVHYQQSMLLAKALELNDIQFRQQTYPDEDHGLSSVRRHLYHTFENFLDECFDASADS